MMSVRQIADSAYFLGSYRYQRGDGVKAMAEAVGRATVLAEENKRPIGRVLARLLCLTGTVEPVYGCKCDRCPSGTRKSELDRLAAQKIVAEDGYL